MTFSNGLLAAQNTPVVHTDAWKEAIQALILLLAPITPHLSEEFWFAHWGRVQRSSTELARMGRRSRSARNN